MEYLFVLHTAIALTLRSVFAAYFTIVTGVDLGLPALNLFADLAQRSVFAAYRAIATGVDLGLPALNLFADLAQRSVFAAYRAIATGVDLGLPALNSFATLAQRSVFAAHRAIAAGVDLGLPGLNSFAALAQRSVFAAHRAIAAGVDLGLPGLNSFAALAQRSVFAAHRAIAAGVTAQLPRVLSVFSHYTGYGAARPDPSTSAKLKAFFVHYCGGKQARPELASHFGFIKQVYAVIGNWIRSATNQCVKATGTAAFVGQRNSPVYGNQFIMYMLCAIICISFIVILYLVVDRRRLRIQSAQAEKQLLKRNYFSVVLSLEVEQAKSRMAKRELDMLMREEHEDIAEIADLTTRIDKTDNVLQKMDGILKSTMLIIGEIKAETEIQSSTPGKKD